jgi:hypothetical protein
MQSHVITYTTHNQGSFNELINNEYGIKVKVLGWGEKWEGFMSKVYSVYNYIKTLPDEDIIIVVDGFDVIINKPIEVILERFYKLNTDILVSKGIDFFNLEFKIFGTCNSKFYANAGLYMGYNKHIQSLLKSIISYSNLHNIQDDQMCLNKVCEQFNNIKVDSDKIVFNNIEYIDRIIVNYTDSCFISNPGEISWDRIKRVPFEYSKYVWKETLVICILLIIIIYYVHSLLTSNIPINKHIYILISIIFIIKLIYVI